MSRRSKLEGRYTVTGPYEEDHPVPNVGAGISCAQTFATKHRDKGPLTYYVRAMNGDVLAVVALEDDGVITTRAHSGFTEYAA